jgi:hypothetical protein
MLDRFFEFVRVRLHMSWVHWNMRDVNYGFAAIEHRYRVLGGTPIQIAEDRKFDLARALVDLYGVGYIGHPRLETLLTKNRIAARDFLSGAQEADAFEKKNSCDCINQLLEKSTSSQIFSNALLISHLKPMLRGASNTALPPQL